MQPAAATGTTDTVATSAVPTTIQTAPRRRVRFVRPREWNIVLMDVLLPRWCRNAAVNSILVKNVHLKTGGIVGTVADPIFEHPRLAAIYDALDPDRSDLDVSFAISEQLGARCVVDVGCGTGTFALL